MHFLKSKITLQWRHMNVMTFSNRRLFNSLFWLTTKKTWMVCCDYWPFPMGIHWWPMSFHHCGKVQQHKNVPMPWRHYKKRVGLGKHLPTWSHMDADAKFIAILNSQYSDTKCIWSLFCICLQLQHISWNNLYAYLVSVKCFTYLILHHCSGAWVHSSSA